eukprot:s7512_g2.t1
MPVLVVPGRTQGIDLPDPAVDAWGVFNSPCDGVVWDSSLHGWTALPPVDAVGPGRSYRPELFAPAELGMEGAKLAAIRRRREMEAEAAEAPKAVASAGRRQVEPPAAGPRNSGKHQALSSSASVPSSATEARRKQTSSRGAPLSRSRVLPGPRLPRGSVSFGGLSS